MQRELVWQLAVCASGNGSGVRSRPDRRRGPVWPPGRNPMGLWRQRNCHCLHLLAKKIGEVNRPENGNPRDALGEAC